MSILWVIADPTEAIALGEAKDPSRGRLSLSLSDQGLELTEIMGLVRILSGLDLNPEVELLYQQMDVQRMAFITQVPPKWVAALASLEDVKRPAIATKWRESVDEYLQSGGHGSLVTNSLAGRSPGELEDLLGQLCDFARQATKSRMSILQLTLSCFEGIGEPSGNPEMPQPADIDLQDVATLKELVQLNEQRQDPPEVLAGALSLLAHALWKEGDVLEGLASARRAADIYARLLQAGRTDLDERAGPLAFNLGSTLLRHGATAEAAASFRSAATCYERLVDKGASDYRLPFADAKDKLGACLLFEGALEPVAGTSRPDYLAEAVVALRDAIALFERMLQEGHPELEPNLAASKHNLDLVSRGGKGEIKVIPAPQVLLPP
jgi:hypothetical protein